MNCRAGLLPPIPFLLLVCILLNSLFLISLPNKTLIPVADRCHHDPLLTLVSSPIIPATQGCTTFAVFVCDRSYASDAADHSYPASPNHLGQQILAPASHLSADNKEIILVASQGQDHVYRPSVAGGRQNSLSRVQQPHVPQPPDTMLNGPRPQIVKDYGYAFQYTHFFSGLGMDLLFEK